MSTYLALLVINFMVAFFVFNFALFVYGICLGVMDALTSVHEETEEAPLHEALSPFSIC
jgi:hypothetical protein